MRLHQQQLNISWSKRTPVLILVNIMWVLLLGFMTVSLTANLNSRVGAVVLSFLIPTLILSIDKESNSLRRFIKYGTGLFSYVILAIAIAGLKDSFTTMLLPCIVISLAMLLIKKN